MRTEWAAMSPAEYAEAVPDDKLRDELRRARFHEREAYHQWERAALVMGILITELRAHTGHFGADIEEVLGDDIHDRRSRVDGSCVTCRILKLAEEVMGPRP